MKPLSHTIVTAAERLQQQGWEMTRSQFDLFKIASDLRGEKYEFDRWHIFETTDWGGGAAASTSTEASFGIGGRDSASLLLAALRGMRQKSETGLVPSRHRVTYQLVMEVEHPLSHGSVAWIDAETGEVKKTRPWLTAEEEAVKTLTEGQLSGLECVNCGKALAIFGKPPTEPRGCGCCPKPSKMIARQIRNTRAAIESGVAA